MWRRSRFSKLRSRDGFKPDLQRTQASPDLQTTQMLLPLVPPLIQRSVCWSLSVIFPQLIFLPNPLSFGKTGGETILDYFAWGHRLRIYTQAGFCLFDGVLKEVPVLELNLRGAFALPAMSAKGDELTAYDFEEANGFLKSHWVLSELSIMFNPLVKRYVVCHPSLRSP